MNNPSIKTILVCGIALFAAACGKGPANTKASGGQGIPVQTETAKLQTVANMTEYLGTVRSLNSSVIQPQVEGYVTRILVHAGEKVRVGQPLIQIDPLKQEATVNTQ